MSTLLQRMARRARESPLEPTPRIEPLLRTSFAPRAGEAVDGVFEEHREVEAREPGVLHAAAPGVHASEVGRTSADATPQRPGANATQAPARPAHVVVHATKEAGDIAPAQAPGTAHALQRRTSQARIDPLLSAKPSAPPKAHEPARNTRRDNEFATPPLAPEQRFAEHAAHTEHRERVALPSTPTTPAARAPTPPRAAPPPAAAPTVTINFGRVEVRAASAPPAPPRAPFRPAVSLDAFLRRGGGNTR
ncbi:hypothetical protein [Paraburkholderia unamae]|uniref:Uncharacterized protein n=1 Tax=Paraburkholderia unamae TaxID=219649 RepID=A0ABX5KTJ7_9BURK|nr:hypothetical protein [Paraburkholderia unamae]PVX85138.1 hypothetical protein C7402_104382 [Paraburkholderia unamae]RAR65772.1 hypothetical protein C7401_10378 [Paraburkholderia unamae]